MALRQLQRRSDYEQAQVDTALKTSAIAIGNADPDDSITFDAARQEGLDLIDKMGVDPGIRQQKAKDWFSTAAKARFEARIARDPKRALEMFGVGTPAVISDAADVQPMEWIRVSGSSDTVAAKGDRLGRLTPDERVAQAFGDSDLAPDPMAIKPATDHLADLSPDDIQRLINQAHAANEAQLIEARTNIALASQNAPDAIANTGSYSGKMPDPADFAAVYGTQEGEKQYRDFAQKIDVGRQAFGMRTMPNQAIHAALRDAEPTPGSSSEEQTRYQTTAAAALKTLSMRRADPAGYARAVFPNVDAAWKAATGPDSDDATAYQIAIARSIAAQELLDLQNIQPVPNSFLGDLTKAPDIGELTYNARETNAGIQGLSGLDPGRGQLSGALENEPVQFTSNDEQNRNAYPSTEVAGISKSTARNLCIDFCTKATLPTGTLDGAPFHYCIARCMENYGH